MDTIKPLADAIPLDQVRRVLVIKLRHHGDVLLSSPVFTTLKHHAPHAEIDALVYADTADMLTLHPAIRTVHTVDRNWKKLGPMGQLKAEGKLFSALRAAKYDLIVHLTEHWRGAWLAKLLKVRWAVGPKRSGNKRWSRSFTHCFSHPRQSPRHVVEANLDALRRLGIYPTLAQRQLVLVPGKAADQKVAAHLSKLGLMPGQFIHIHPASRWFFKCWPVASMAALVRRLQAEGHAVLLTAAPSRDELDMVAAIQARLPEPVPSLAGQLSLKELAAVTGQAKLFIGVDSAPMHMAAAMGTPTVALFGPSGDRQWGPWGVPARVVASTRHTCRPCGIDGCGGGKVSDCLVSLTPEEVHAAAMELLAQ